MIAVRDKTSPLEKAFKKRPADMTFEEYRYVCDHYRPNDYFESGDRDDPLYENGWRSTGFSVHRDSDILARSNWEVISEDLKKRFPKHIADSSASHWVVGWLDGLRVRLYTEKGNLSKRGLEALEACYEWHRELDRYPVANEDHHSQMEMNAIDEAWDGYRQADVIEYIKKTMPGICKVDRELQAELAAAGEDPDDFEEHPEVLIFDLNEEFDHVDPSNGYVSTLKLNEMFAYRLHMDAAYNWGVDEMWITEDFVEERGPEVWRETYLDKWDPDAEPPQYEPYEKWLPRFTRESQIAAGQLYFA